MQQESDRMGFMTETLPDYMFEGNEYNIIYPKTSNEKQKTVYIESTNHQLTTLTETSAGFAHIRLCQTTHKLHRV